MDAGSEIVYVQHGLGLSSSSSSMRLVPSESIQDVLICEAVSVVGLHCFDLLSQSELLSVVGNVLSGLGIEEGLPLVSGQPHATVSIKQPQAVRPKASPHCSQV